MPRTDTQSLALAIEEFEAEFPELDWTFSSATGYVIIFKDVKVVASGFDLIDKPAAFRECARQIRVERIRTRVAAEHDAAMTAEYGPEIRR